MASSSFGTDTSCTDSLRTGRMVTGPRLVAEACYRRLTTPRGMLRGGEEEANYGLDISQMIGASSRAAASWPGRIVAELKKDERIESVAVTYREIASGPARSVILEIVGMTGEGPFDLTLSVSEVTVALLKLEAA